jgi:hypothetical protein
MIKVTLILSVNDLNQAVFFVCKNINNQQIRIKFQTFKFYVMITKVESKGTKLADI